MNIDTAMAENIQVADEKTGKLLREELLKNGNSAIILENAKANERGGSCIQQSI